nr:hypothetical protein [Flaviaesturariibacter flavus]
MSMVIAVATILILVRLSAKSGARLTLYLSAEVNSSFASPGPFLLVLPLVLPPASAMENFRAFESPLIAEISPPASLFFVEHRAQHLLPAGHVLPDHAHREAVATVHLAFVMKLQGLHLFVDEILNVFKKRGKKPTHKQSGFTKFGNAGTFIR